MSRVMIIGLDGGSFDVIGPWVREGKLPNIARLMQAGTSVKLKTTIPPMTFPAWNAFMTGKNPGKHGVFDFMERRPGTYELDIMNALHRKSETLWKIASAHGKRCAVIGVPVTYPPEEINGVLISGFDAPFADARIMQPPGLFEELKENVGEYIVTGNFTKHLKTGDIDTAVREMCSAIDRKAATAKYIQAREPWDLFMFVFGETDAAIHHFWKYHDRNSPQSGSLSRRVTIDPVYEIYKRVDHHIGELLRDVGEDTVVIVMSDHGVGGVSNKVIYLNRFLEAHRLLKFRKRALFINRNMDRLKARIRFLLPTNIAKYLLFSPRNVGLQWEAKLRFSYIDWENTQAYAEENPHYPHIKINLRGREPGGIVEESEYQSVVDKVVAALKTWVDPETGSRVVREVFRKEDIYHGEYLGKAPDLLISWNYDNGYSYLSRPSFAAKKKVYMEKMDIEEIEKSDFMFNRSGSHRDEGIFMIRGEKIRRDAYRDGEVEIMDIAPTVLYLLDIPVPSAMDGKVLLDCIERGPSRMPQYNESATDRSGPDYRYSEEETKEINEKLKGLGYM